nr:hypothetical protein [Nanoarchaeum sp.]
MKVYESVDIYKSKKNRLDREFDRRFSKNNKNFDSIDKKIKELDKKQNQIYTNIVAIMSIFVVIVTMILSAINYSASRLTWIEIICVLGSVFLFCFLLILVARIWLVK